MSSLSKTELKINAKSQMETKSRQERNIFDELKIDQPSTYVIVDNINFKANIGGIIRNGCIHGMTHLVLCPPTSDFMKTHSSYFDLPDSSDDEESDKNIKSNNNTKECDKYDTLACISNKYIYSNKFLKNAKRVAMKHAKYVKIFPNYDIIKVIQAGLQNGFKVFMLENKLKNDIYEAKLTHKKTMFIVGNEKFGVREEVRDLCTRNIIDGLSIPSCIDQTSLNVMCVTVIALYERQKQLCLASKT